MLSHRGPQTLWGPYGSSLTSNATVRRRQCKCRQSLHYGTPASRLHTPPSNPTPPVSHHLQSRQSEREEKNAHPAVAPNRPEETAGQQPPRLLHLRRPSGPTRRPPLCTPPPPARTKHPHHPPFRHWHGPSSKRTHSSKEAQKSNSLSATSAQTTGSAVRARSSNASRTRVQTVGCKSGCNGTARRSSSKAEAPRTSQRATP